MSTTQQPRPLARPGADDHPAPPVLELRDLVVRYGHGASAPTVLHGVSATVPRGRCVGVVGESGSGKSTLAKAVVGMAPVSGGSVLVEGRAATPGRRTRTLPARRDVQYIPQDPFSSLDPRMTIGRALAESLDPRRGRVGPHRELIARWLETVRLPADAIDRYPHEFSGGQRQRIAIARGLALGPRLVIADEITSALDVSVQAEILAMIGRLREELDLTLLFISHDLAVVRRICDDVIVLRHGEIVEQGPVASVYDSPRHPYTRLLLDSVPGSPGFTLDPAPVPAERNLPR